MKGTLYGVGIGPGDPELLTLKAVRLIRENEVIALPGEDPKETVAYKISVRGAAGYRGSRQGKYRKFERWRAFRLSHQAQLEYDPHEKNVSFALKRLS